MKSRVVRIGNSRGIRIPKLLLEQTGLRGDVEISADGDTLVIRPACRPRDRLGRGLRGNGAARRRRPARRARTNPFELGRHRVGMVINRFEVYLVNLDPTVGSEIRKTRPCLVVSPDELNHHIRTVLVAPMTTKGRSYPTRVPCRFKGKAGQVVLDQIRTVDRVRLIKKLGILDAKTGTRVLETLQEMFAP